MEIQVVKERSYYRADCLDLSGCPPNGFGTTAVNAVCHLFYRLIAEQRGGPTNENWTSRVKLNNEIIINGEKWNWPEEMLER